LQKYYFFSFFSTFQKLQQKLGLDEQDYHQVSPLRTSETASTSHSEAAHNSRDHISVIDRIHEEDSGGHQKSLNNDTIILVCSLVVMIIIGITFHRIISYFAQVRSRRRACRRGLKQLGEHMHIVTRTISNPPSVDPTPTGTPTISMRKLALLNNNRIAQSDVPQSAAHGLGSAKPRARSPLPVPSDDDSVFKPSTHVMRREDSELGVLTTAAHLHHIEHLQDHQPHHQHHHNR